MFAVAVPVALFGAMVLVSGLVSGHIPELGSLGEADYLGKLGVLPVLMLWVITYGLGEEVGWRGFALPRLQATHTALGASLVLGLFWTLWHLPAIFYRDTYVDMGWMVIPMLLTIATAGPTVYTWLFNTSRGSLLPAILLHGLFDYFSVWEGGLLGGAVSAGMILTIFLIFWGRARLQALRRQEPCTPRQGDDLTGEAQLDKAVDSANTRYASRGGRGLLPDGGGVRTPSPQGALAPAGAATGGIVHAEKVTDDHEHAPAAKKRQRMAEEGVTARRLPLCRHARTR